MMVAMKCLRANSVEYFGWTPYWLGWRMLKLVRNLESWLRKAFSNIFEMLVSIATGWYLVYLSCHFCILEILRLF